MASGPGARRTIKRLVVSFAPPPCDYWIFQLCNLWQENFDNYEDGQGTSPSTAAASSRTGRCGW